MPDIQVDYLLIGGGRTSANAAQAIRESDPNGSITIVAGENRKPYDRPPLSKNFLQGKPANPDDVESKPDDFFEKHRVDLIRGIWADRLDRATKTVQLRDGRNLVYGKLLLATGCAPAPLPLPGGEHAKLLRSVDDSMQIRDTAKGAKSVVLIGSGFIGMEVSAALTGLGIKCTVVARDPYPWSKFLSEQAGRFLQSYHESKGVSFHMNAGIAGVEPGGVRLQTGDLVAGDLTVAGVGVKQHRELAEQAGLQIDERHGVVVDETLRTADPNVWAAGDIAAYQDINFGKRWHLEHYMNAEWQGTHVGKNMAGANAPFDQIPYFFSDMFELSFILRGDPEGGKPAKLLGDLNGGEFTELYANEQGQVVKGIAFTKDYKRQDEIGDKIAQFSRERRPVESIAPSEFYG